MDQQTVFFAAQRSQLHPPVQMVVPVAAVTAVGRVFRSEQEVGRGWGLQLGLRLWQSHARIDRVLFVSLRAWHANLPHRHPPLLAVAVRPACLGGTGVQTLVSARWMVELVHGAKLELELHQFYQGRGGEPYGLADRQNESHTPPLA